MSGADRQRFTGTQRSGQPILLPVLEFSALFYVALVALQDVRVVTD